MPTGLDGNPDPVVTPARTKVLGFTTERIRRKATTAARTLVAVDGRSGSGKSTFADELARALVPTGLGIVRSTTDSFHRPRVERARLGPTSAEGYYFESHQLDVIVHELLEPFAGGDREVLMATFDEPSDSSRRRIALVDLEPSVLIFDGLFLQRPELASFWNDVIYLSADRRLDQRWVDFLLTGLPDDPSDRATMLDTRLERARWPRYRHGWLRYLEAVDPEARASLVIDNNDVAHPQLVMRPMPPTP